MDIKEIENISKHLAPVIKQFVDAKLLAFSVKMEKQVEAVRQSIPAAIKGEDGKSVEITDVLPEIERLVSEAVSKISVAQAPTLEEVVESFTEKMNSHLEKISNTYEKTIADLTEKLNAAVAAIPAPKDGKDGADGKDGKDGRDGTDGKDGSSVTLEDVRPMLEEAVKQIEERVETVLSNVKDGKDGVDGKSVGIDEVRPMFEELASQLQQKVDASLANVKDGKDGSSVTLEDLQPVIAQLSSEVRNKVDEFCSTIKDGKDGIDGKDGTSVTAEDIRPLLDKMADEFRAEIKAFCDSIPHPKDGRDGIDGKSITVEEILPEIKNLLSEEVAKIPRPKDGEKGEKGDRGEDGKDALNIEVLPTIDESKSYPRGTYATYKGGVWRSYEKTFEMRGWECILNGLDRISLKEEDERNVKVVLHMSNGATEEKDLLATKNIVLYRGVFKDNSEAPYEKGDVVTHAGSSWYCQKQTKARPGAGNSDWTLMVKRGRDYKEPVKIQPVDPNSPVKFK